MFYMDWTMALLVPGLILAFWAQSRVTRTFKQYSAEPNQRGITGAQVARDILANNGISDVEVETIAGDLTDHYSPTEKKLRLSQSVYGSTSIAAIGVAAHEAGHAIQHHRGWFPIKARNAVVPVFRIGSYLAWPLFFLGWFMGSGGLLLMQIGIIAFSAVILFHIVTLPVEFDASRRALAVIKSSSYLDPGEYIGAKKVLQAAAMTYVASALMAILNLVRMLILSNRR